MSEKKKKKKKKKKRKITLALREKIWYTVYQVDGEKVLFGDEKRSLNTTTNNTNRKVKTKMKKLMFAAAVVGAMVMSAEAVYSVDLSQGRKAELPAAVSGYAEPQSATTCYFLFGNGGASNRSGFITAFSNAIKGDTLESIFNSFGSKGTDWVELGYDDFKGWGTHHILESDTATVGTLIAILAADDGTTWACLPWTDATLKADGTATHGQSWAGSGGVVYDAVAYFEGGYGWIHSAAVAPEPTSALLMLFGLAGLALKRKVA